MRGRGGGGGEADTIEPGGRGPGRRAGTSAEASAAAATTRTTRGRVGSAAGGNVCIDEGGERGAHVRDLAHTLVLPARPRPPLRPVRDSSPFAAPIRRPPPLQRSPRPLPRARWTPPPDAPLRALASQSHVLVPTPPRWSRPPRPRTRASHIEPASATPTRSEPRTRPMQTNFPTERSTQRGRLRAHRSGRRGARRSEGAARGRWQSGSARGEVTTRRKKKQWRTTRCERKRWGRLGVWGGGERRV